MGAASKPPPLYNKVHGGEVFYGAPGAVCVCETSGTIALLGQSANGRQLRAGDKQANGLICIISILH